MCNLYSITTNQAAVAALFTVLNRYKTLGKGPSAGVLARDGHAEAGQS
jgi:hypothetical protein